MNFNHQLSSATPKSIAELMQRAHSMMGRSIGQIAQEFNLDLPTNRLHAKGWMGQCIEYVLGALSGSRPQPDFPHLGIELKTIPVDNRGNPMESTYICVAPMTFTFDVHFTDSLVWEKISHVLWVPYEGEKALPFAQRRIGEARLWQPSTHDCEILQQDWEEHIERLRLGDSWQRNARFGQYLQLRPKAANRAARRLAIQDDGTLGPSLPLGFYLRSSFTRKILQS